MAPDDPNDRTSPVTNGSGGAPDHPRGLARAVEEVTLALADLFAGMLGPISLAHARLEAGHPARALLHDLEHQVESGARLVARLQAHRREAHGDRDSTADLRAPRPLDVPTAPGSESPDLDAIRAARDELERLLSALRPDGTPVAGDARVTVTHTSIDPDELADGGEVRVAGTRVEIVLPEPGDRR